MFLSATLFEPGGGQQVADQAVQPVYVQQHCLNEAVDLLLGELSQTDGFQVKLDRCEGRFQLMGDLGNGLFLLLVQIGLAPPENEDHIDAGQHQEKKDYPLDKHKPVVGVNRHAGFVLGGKFLEFLVPSEKPVNPENNHQHPYKLDADEGYKWVEDFPEQLHGFRAFAPGADFTLLLHKRFSFSSKLQAPVNF
jgi:hypothetical protein